MSEPGGGGGGGDDGPGGLEVSAVQNVADVAVLQKHLRKLVPLLLEDGGDAPAALEAALEEKSALEQMRKFLADPQVHTVLVERSTLKGAPGPVRSARVGPPRFVQTSGPAKMASGAGTAAAAAAALPGLDRVRPSRGGGRSSQPSAAGVTWAPPFPLRGPSGLRAGA